MSRSRPGVSTFSFIRSSSVVPPAMYRTSAPCCAVFACAAVMQQRQAEARVHAAAIYMHRAGAALAVITTFLRAGERNGLTDAIQQRCARIDAKRVILAVNAQCDRDGSLNVGRGRDCRRAV